MKFLLDTHTHTIASGHAYNTIIEMVEEASKKGLGILGITEHAPTMPGSCHEFYFQNLKAVDREYIKEKYNIELILGVELNLLDEKGTVDLPTRTIKGLDVTIASLHKPCFSSMGLEKNTEAVVSALKNPLIDIIGHPDDSRIPILYEPVVKMAKEQGKLLEVNNSSLNPKGYRVGARENYKIMLELCKKYNQPVVVNSDAHFCTAVGNFANVEGLFEEVGFPEELVVNTSLEKFKTYIQKYKKK